jgi:RimJ/RimL family protein N-acetyltransferase
MRLFTDRLALRPVDAGDLEPLAAMMRDPEVCRFIGDGRPRSRERVERTVRFAAHLWRERGFGLFAIEREGRFLGVCLLVPIARSGTDPGAFEARGPEIEIGYWLARDAWGQGYATEAAGAVLRWAMSDAGAALDRVIAVTHPSHERSQRVLGRIGMERVGETDAYYDTTTVLFESPVGGVP